MATPPRLALTGLALAGGESRRFGTNKALALFRGEPLLLHAIRGLARVCAEVLVIAKEPARYRAIAEAAGARLVPDRSPLSTPLAGLEAGLLCAEQKTVFACAADMPFAADAALLAALSAVLHGHDAAAPVHRGELQPLCALFVRSACLAVASELLREGAGVRALLERVRTARIDWADITPFLDADTPDALRALEAS